MKKQEKSVAKPITINAEFSILKKSDLKPEDTLIFMIKENLKLPANHIRSMRDSIREATGHDNVLVVIGDVEFEILKAGQSGGKGDVK